MKERESYVPVKQRLFVDMDGTLAVFTPVDTMETLYEEGYKSSSAEKKDNAVLPHLLAISILSDIVYWYRPKEIRDETTGH